MRKSNIKKKNVLFVFDNRWITVPQLVNAFYVITKNEIGMNISTYRVAMLRLRSKNDVLPERGKTPTQKGQRMWQKF